MFEVCYWFAFVIMCFFVQAIVDVAVSKEELDHVVVKEAFEEFGIAYKKQDVKEKEEVECLLHNHEGEIVDLEHSISELEELIAKWKGERRKDEVCIPLHFFVQAGI